MIHVGPSISLREASDRLYEFILNDVNYHHLSIQGIGEDEENLIINVYLNEEPGPTELKVPEIWYGFTTNSVVIGEIKLEKGFKN